MRPHSARLTAEAVNESELTRYPADGSTRCIVNCKCELETREGKRGFSNG